MTTESAQSGNASPVSTHSYCPTEFRIIGIDSEAPIEVDEVMAIPSIAAVL